jgi:hypothetical protein
MTRGQRTPITAPQFKGSVDNTEFDTAALDDIDVDEPVAVALDTDYAARATKDYADELAFAAQKMKIILHPGPEKYSPLFQDVYVNGVAKFVQVGVETELPRCYVEVLARAQARSISTEAYKLENSPEAATVNRMVPRVSSQYHFTVVNDPSPRGRAWLQGVMSGNA